MFINRVDAGLQLADNLLIYKNTDAVILALPKGGVPIAYTVALELNLKLDIVLTKKIGHPSNREYAIGSVSPRNVYINEIHKDISKTYLESEVERLKKELNEKYLAYTEHIEPVDFKNKTIIIVDDGIATGHTMIGTIDLVKMGKPKKIVVAIPVGPKEAIEKIKRIVDEIICLEIPENFVGVGQFYENFEQVSDDEVIRLLKKINKKESLKASALE